MTVSLRRSPRPEADLLRPEINRLAAPIGVGSGGSDRRQLHYTRTHSTEPLYASPAARRSRRLVKLACISGKTAARSFDACQYRQAQACTCANLKLVASTLVPADRLG